MPGRTVTTWAKAWRTSETKVIRVPAALADQLLKLAHAIEDGAEIKVIPQPTLFDNLPKRKQRVTSDVPRRTKPKKGKPVTSKKRSTPKPG